jgi:chromosome condensin MukBEF MukE localization factor
MAVVSVPLILMGGNYIHAVGTPRNTAGDTSLQRQKFNRSVAPSLNRLRLFLLLITILFVGELTAAIVVFATGDKIVD